MLSTTTRLSNLNDREKRFLVGGAIIAVLLLGWLLWPSGAANQSDVELVPAGQRGAPAATAPPAPAPVAAVPVPVVPAAPAAPVAPAGAAPEGLRLYGVLAGGAIIGTPDGNQRYVALGRELMPGLRLQSVSVHHAILAAAATNYRLGFNGGPVAMAPPGGGAAPPPSLSRQVGNASPVEAQRMAAERAQTAQYAQILSPRQVNGQTAGYTIRPGAAIPAFERAGLQPGDTILSVNGTPLNAEQLQELAWTINNSTRTEFVVERGGRRMSFTLEGQR